MPLDPSYAFKNPKFQNAKYSDILEYLILDIYNFQFQCCVYQKTSGSDWLDGNMHKNYL